MTQQAEKLIVIAHSGLEKKITEEECKAALTQEGGADIIFVDFEIGNASLGELYYLPYENIALAQQRKFNEILKPILDANPTAKIAYFGLTPIPVAFHLGYLVGFGHPFSIYQWHHRQMKWYKTIEPPTKDYKFQIVCSDLPQEVQKGKGDIAIRIGTSYQIDRLSTYEVVQNPANEFDLTLSEPHIDSLYNQENILAVVEAFQRILNCYTNKLRDRENIHLFLATSTGLPFALGTLINPTIYPYIQTYQYSREEIPKYKEAIFISKESDERVALTDEQRSIADEVRAAWGKQLHNKIKPFIQSITGRQSNNWLQTICNSDEEYAKVAAYLKEPWDKVTDINGTSLKDDTIELSVKDVEDGFEYIEKTNSWLLDDGFLAGLNVRLAKNRDTDILQAGRLFFFHEALHYSKNGHKLTRETANGIGQFPKVIEEADYQADVWALLTEYKYCLMYEPEKLRNGIKQFFCNAIETAVETMWSFVDNGQELTTIQIRAMNRFLNWYWQWLNIENLDGMGNIEDVICILFNKPVIEFAGAPMALRAHRTFYQLNVKNLPGIQLAAFINNKVFRFAPNTIQDLIDGFKMLNGNKIKTGLKSFMNMI